MGCSGSRKNICQEEVALMGEELTLNFHAVSASTAFNIFSVMTRQHYLNQIAFEEAASALNLQTHNTGSSTMIEQFYKNLTDAKGFPAKKLKILSVLLCSGTAEEKAATLFQIYDETYELSLQSSQLRQMLSDMISLSTDHLGVLVTSDQSHNSGSLRNREYLKKLGSVKSAFIEKTLSDLLGPQSQIGREQFFQYLCSPQAEGLLSASNLRVTMSEFKRDLNRVSGSR